VVAESFRFNVPVLWAKGAAQPQSFVSSDDQNVVVDTIKKAEDSDATVIRLYEAHGARGTARLKCAWPVSSASFCNILEQEQRPAEVKDGQIVVPYLPSQVISVLLK
jgi:alpha-mannosidase